MSLAEKTKTFRFPESEIRQALLNCWKNEAEERNAFAGEKSALEEGTIYDLLPQIDSLTVVRSFAALEVLLEIEIPCEIVKRGGYSSNDEFTRDLLPKLKSLFEKHYGKS
jgi:hypothetical protein